MDGISVVMPAYNEEACLERVIREWMSVLNAEPDLRCWEIVVCDDGSRDATGSILEGLALTDPRIVVMHHRENLGAAAALSDALALSRYDWVLFTDADGQFPANNLSSMLRSLRLHPEVRAVSGVRLKKIDRRSRRLGAHLTNRAVNMAHHSRMGDVSSIFKLVDGSLVRSLPLESTSLNFSVELASAVMERGVEWLDVPVVHHHRMSGVPSWRPSREFPRRLAFIGYVLMRQLFIRWGVIRVRSSTLGVSG